MDLLNRHIGNAVVLCILFFLVSSCASTRITRSWVEPGNTKSYNNILVIGVGESEQTRRAYEGYFVEELRDKSIKAVASYTLIKSNEKINRDTVGMAIKGMGIDGVIVTHLVAVDEETVYRPSMEYMPMYGGVYYGNLYSYYPHVNTYVHRPGYYTTHEAYTIETSLYDVASEDLVWSARTRTFSPESVDEVIVDLTDLLIKDMADKKLIDIK